MEIINWLFSCSINRDEVGVADEKKNNLEDVGNLMEEICNPQLSSPCTLNTQRNLG